METVTIGVSGMSCGHCVKAVEKALGGLAGVTVTQVEIGSATVAYDPAVIGLSAVEAAIDDAGYDVVKGRVLNIMSDTKADSKSNA